VSTTAQKTAASPRKLVQERARHAALWRLGYAEAKPPLRLVCKVFGVSAPTVIKAVRQLKNGNGHAPASPSINDVVRWPTIDDLVRWWAAASDTDRAAFVRAIGVGSAWRAIESNLG
jgi:hypothetical protein